MIINTRPKNLSGNLISLCEAQEIALNNIYLSKINSIGPSKIAIDKIKNIHSYSNLIFTSQAAASYGLDILKSFFDLDVLPHNFLSVGPATSNKLLESGIKSHFPQSHSSEGILKLIEKNFLGKSLLFCGENSNGFLQQKLKASLDEIVCYEVIYLLEQIPKVTNNNEIFLIYNFNTLKFLITNLDDAVLRKKIFIVASENIKCRCQNEFKELEIHVSQSPTDKMMIDMAKNFI